MAADTANHSRIPGRAAAQPIAGGERIISLDFVRGVAVLGILFANIVAFAHPQAAYWWPGAFPAAHDGTEKALWLAQYVFVDGKMRGLFTLLFGAGLALFLERALARGQGCWLQVRRLFWLMVFGLLHFFLLFWGDILFLYALSGLVALPLLRLPGATLLRLGIVWYICGGLFLSLLHGGGMVSEQSSAIDAATRAAQEVQRESLAVFRQGIAAERGVFLQGSYTAELAYVLEQGLPRLAEYPWVAMLETIPLILIGVGLYRRGLFSGCADPQRLRRWGWAGLAAGIALSLPLGLWAVVKDFPLFLSDFVFNGISQLFRLPMILGLAALLSCWAAHASRGWIGARIVAAGRMAFSNYIGTSIVMLLIFRSWAGGYYGSLNRIELLVLVLLGWVAMLAWSKPWLAHFYYGPLEWCWRCLTYGRLVENRRIPLPAAGM